MNLKNLCSGDFQDRVGDANDCMNSKVRERAEPQGDQMMVH
jgi:hypothetical protein